jgi:signal transduction histidine kinase
MDTATQDSTATDVISSVTTPRRKLNRLFAGVVALLLIGEIAAMTGFYHEAIWEGEQRVESAARLAETNLVRTFESANYILTQVAELGRSKPMADLADDEAAWRQLLGMRAGLPEEGTLWIVDAEGTTRLSSVYFPTPEVDVRDRDYYSAHISSRRELAVGPMVQTKRRDFQAFHISRRIEDSSGRLLGIAVVGFDAPVFSEFHHSLDLGHDSNLTVVRRDGQIVMRQPDPARYVGKLANTGPITTMLAAGLSEGVVRTVSPLDQVERLRAFRLVPRYDVVVAVGMAMDDVLELWWEILWGSMAGLVALLAVLGGMARQALAALDREAALIDGLEATLSQRTTEAETRAREARLANESKTRFLAAASHDLRQPLQAAGMFAEVLAGRLEDTPDMPIVDKLRQSLDATQLLLTTLLDVSTLEAGHVEAHPTAFPLAPLLSNLADQLELEAQTRKLDFKVVLTDSWVISDPVLLERVVRNLLVNAFRYTKTGGVLLGCRKRGQDVAICVVDTGVGIPQDKFSAIFEDFTRLADKGRGPDRGLGLGLSVVRRTAQLLRHPVEVTSTVGKGSCFSVVVPLAKG